jgi:hypothetical protein
LARVSFSAFVMMVLPYEPQICTCSKKPFVSAGAVLLPAARSFSSLY